MNSTFHFSARKKELFYTVFTNFILQVVTAVCGFVLPPLIIRTFGSSVNGMVSSIAQFIAYLNIVEAGVGGASIAALYKPLALGDKTERNAILSATRKFYNRSGIIFTLLIFALAFVYPLIVGNEVDRMQAALMVLVLGITRAAEFFLIGKYRVLLTADKKMYVISLVQMAALAVSTVLSVVLIKAGFGIVVINFVSAIVYLGRYVFIAIYVHKNYSELNFHAEPDTQAISQSRNVLVHQFGSLIVYNLPLLLITVFCSLKDASVYMVYALVFNSVNSILGVLSNGINAFFGESLVKDSIYKTRNIYHKYGIVFYTAEAWCYAMAYLLTMPFMKIYTVGMTDANYIQPLLAALFVAEGVLNNIRQPGVQLVAGAGHFKQTQGQLLVEVALRFVFSVVFTIRFGMIGVLLGGLISYAYRAIVLVVYPCRKILKKSALSSFVQIGKVLVFTAGIVFGITKINFNFVNSYASWILAAVIYGVSLGAGLLGFTVFTRLISNRIESRIFARQIIRAVSKLPQDEEKKDVVEYLKKNPVSVFPYSFTKKYHSDEIQSYTENGFPYVVHNGRKLYGKKSWSEKKLREYYTSLLCEQDEASPHRYLIEGRYPEKGDVVADIGAAEGIFSLDVIDYAEKIYLFECDETWIEALEKTFAPFKEKVEIVKKYVSDRTEGEMVSLDDFFTGKRFDFIKADIEGAEEAMLAGGERVFKERISKALLCVYHRQDSENDIRKFLERNRFKTELNHGYMLYLYGEPLEPPYIRHGVIFGKRERNIFTSETMTKK